MAEHHLQRLRECGRFEPVGVCDITPARREAAVAEGMVATEDRQQFLDWDTELVVVTTHSAHHRDDAVAALQAGKHVLVEKPMATTGAAAAEMADVAQAAGKILAVYHNRHFDPDYRMVKSAVQEGLLGQIISLENRTGGARPAVGFGTKDYHQEWRITADAGGGTLLDFGPHWVEQVLDLLAPRSVTEVFADVRHVKWGDADDLFQIQLVFDDGVHASIGKYDLAYAFPLPKWLIVATEATLHGPVGDERRLVITGDGWETTRDHSADPPDLHTNLADAIQTGTNLIIPTAHALRVMQVLQAARDSAAAGRSVTRSI